KRDAEVQTVWWDRETHRTVGTFPGVRPCAMAPDGHWVTRGDSRTEFMVRAPASRNEIVRLRRTDDCESVSFSPDAKYLLFEGRETEVVESATGRTCARIPPYREVVVLSDVQQVVAIDGAVERSLLRWDLATGRRLEAERLGRSWPGSSTPLPARGQFLIVD